MIAIYLEPDLDWQIREDAGRQAEHDWAELIEVVTELTQAIRAEREAGTTPNDPRMLALARQWQAVIDHFTCGRAGHRPELRALDRS